MWYSVTASLQKTIWKVLLPHKQEQTYTRHSILFVPVFILQKGRCDMINEFNPISDNFISFCASNMTGVYTIDISHHMMDVWTKTDLKKVLLNDLINNVWLPIQLKIKMIDKLKQKFLNDYSYYNDTFLQTGVKKYRKYAEYSIDLAELCRSHLPYERG